MSVRLIILSVAFLLFAFCLPPPAFVAYGDASPISTATREGRIIVFDDVWETIRVRYYDPSLHGIDWQFERAKFRPLAADARSATEFYAILRRMLGQLRDAHTRVYAPDERSDWQHPRYISVGISVREVSSQPVVFEVERGSDAERAGLRAGDLITSVDNEPALSVFARRLSDQTGASTLAAARLRAMATIFDGARDSVVRVGWIDAGGKERFVNLRREWRKRDAMLRVRRVGGYGVVEFEAFTQTITIDLMRALANRLRGLRGLVIDLRHNGGGETEAMTEIASTFLPAGKNLGRFTDRTGRVAFEPRTRAAMLMAAYSITPFRAPVVILTSERTSSAAEIFVAAVKDARRATILGMPTCGCVLAIRRRHTLPDGGELDVSEMDYRTASGARLEGAGVAPDAKIPLDIRDLRAGRDRALEQAIQFLKASE
jgi:carboxyl-terminal processing protease